MSQAAESIPAERVEATLAKLRDSIGQVVKGKDDVVNDVLVCLLAGGHVLLEDLPGLGKTTLAYCLARSIDCGFSRIQFTSDLLPSDVTGVSVYDEQVKEFVFKKGPVFANIILADEINRTTPKTQSALLEVMDRGKLTAEGQTYKMPSPFIVFATQNPVDYESTFPLPESQMDRFLMRLQMGYAEYDDEFQILRSGTTRYDDIKNDPVITAKEILGFQNLVPKVYVEEDIVHYILRIITATRTESEFRSGASTRGSLAVKTAAQARALANGRDHVIPEDVQSVVRPVLTHRLGLRQTTDVIEERHSVEAILKNILNKISFPAKTGY